MLDRQVQHFLESESCPSGIKIERPQNRSGFGVGLRTVGVRVTCRGERAEPFETKSSKEVNSNNNERREDNNEHGEEECGNERDELIWWSWDGKLVGFLD